MSKRVKTSFSLDGKVLEVLKKRADRQHLSCSRYLENLLRKTFRL